MARIESKSAVSALALIALFAISTGCLEPAKNSNAPLAAAGGTTSVNAQVGAGGLTGFQNTVYQYAVTNCASCHGSNQNPKFAQSDINAAYTVTLNFPLVNFNDVQSSLLVHKVSDGHCGSNCSGAANAQTMTDLITSWKAAFSSSGGDAPAAQTTTATVYTNAIPVPAPNPGQCNLPDDLKCSPDLKVAKIDASGKTLCANKCWTKLRFPVAKMSVVPGTPDSQNPIKEPTLQRAWLEVDFAYENYASNLGIAAYVVRNPRMMSPDGPVFVHDLGLYLNGIYRANYGQAFHGIDIVVDKARFDATDSAGRPICNVPAYPTPVNFGTIDAQVNSRCVPSVAPLFSTAASASDIFQERTTPSRPDMISFSFGYLKSGILGNCKDPAMWLNQVYKPIVRGAIDCLDCHKPAGAVSEAGQRFDMYAQNYVTAANDPDPAKAAAYIAKDYSQLDSATQAQLNVVCQRFLQRTNLQNPSSSPIIVQPIQGLNGMPPRANFLLYNSDAWWLGWIKQESTDLGFKWN